jgi:lipopolysaccharide biosynthesis glycosyltransferase
LDKVVVRRDNTTMDIDDTAILIAADDDYVRPAITLLRSVGAQGLLPSSYPLIVADHGLAPESRRDLEDAARAAGLDLSFRQVAGDDRAELGAVDPDRITTCLRLYAGELCAPIPRILYLDCDMLVLAPLAPLLASDLRGCTAAAVVNHPPFATIGVAVRRSRRGDLAADLPYFNAGLLVIDTARWLDRDIGCRARAYLAANPTTRLLDQDALNVALADDWQALPLIWNAPAGPLDAGATWNMVERLQPSLAVGLDEWRAAQQAPAVLHFTGHPKPWTSAYPWPDLQEQYRRYSPVPLGPGWPLAERPAARTYHRV